MTESRQPSNKAILGVILLARANVNLTLRITYPFLPAISRGLGVSLGAASALVSARSLGGVASPLFGVLSDRLGGRRVMLLGIALAVAGAALTAGLPWYAVALVGFWLMGLAKGAYDPAMQAFVGRRVPYEQRGRALGITELAWSATWLAMPLSGWLIANVSWRAPFVVIVAVGVFSLWLTRRTLSPDFVEPGQATGQRAGALSALSASLAPLWRDRQAWIALSITALLLMAADVLIIVYGAWMEDAFGLTVTALGVVSLAIGAAEAVAELGAALLSDRLGKRRAVFMGLFFMTGGFLLLPRLTGSLAVALAGTVLLVMAFEFSVVSFIPLVSGMSATARGTLMSLNVMAFSVGRMIAAPLAVALYRPGDLTRNGLLSAVMCLAVMGLLSLLRERGH